MEAIKSSKEEMDKLYRLEMELENVRDRAQIRINDLRVHMKSLGMDIKPIYY